MSQDIDQIVDGEGQFRNEVEQYIRSSAEPLGTDYMVIGIIGAQSSGKSTLLNYLFDSKFLVMNSKEMRKQTTRGIWTYFSAKDRTIVLDIEGADSRERWEEKHSYERKTSLFGLVLSNVLMINIWMHEIGRFTAANYEILKTILELNVQHFNKDVSKNIVFVIRDFNEEENFDGMKKLLVGDVNKLWAEVKKPPGLETLAFEKLFKVDVTKLSNFVYEKPRFMQDIAQLSDSLKNRDSPNYLFKGVKFNNIPGDGLYIFMKQSWELIQSNKDVNIPNQKIVVSSFRCNEVKSETLSVSSEEFAQLRRNIEQNPNINIGDEYESIMSKSIKLYNKNTSNYDESIAGSSRAELKASIVRNFEEVFKEHNERHSIKLLKEFEADMKSIYGSSTYPDISSVFSAIMRRKGELSVKYAGYVAGFKFEERRVRELSDVFALRVSNIITGFFSSSINSFFKKLVRVHVSAAESRIFETFHSLSEESWTSFNDYFKQVLNRFREEVDGLRSNYKDLQGIITDELLHTFEKDLAFTLKNNLKNRKSEICDFMIEDFKKKFEMTNAGTRRNWRQLEDSQIDVLFEAAKKPFLTTLQFLENPLVLFYDEDVILSKQDCMKLKTRFQDLINDVYEQAFNKKYNRNSLQRVPKWLWFVLAYFMHDNLLEWMRSPFFFGLLIILSVSIGYLYATEKIHYIKDAVTLLNSFVFAKMNQAGTKSDKTEKGEAQPQGQTAEM